ncbi:DUF7793 family protein [Formosa sp. S-31]|uniref:DUF7793 family protein n=1 Tax=Formosa sp. S-31 TaxID=2790949 RepID=UPI003EBF0852
MQLENDFASTWLKDGVLYSVYKNGVEIQLEAAKLVRDDRLKLQQGKAFPILCDIRGVKHFDMLAKRYFSTDGFVLIKALALISNNPISEVYSKIYIKGSLPSVPINVFKDETNALRFLNEYVDS